MAQAQESKKDKPAHRVLLYTQTTADVSILQDLLAGIGAEGVVCTDFGDLCRQTAHDADAVLLTEQSLTDGALPVLAEALQRQPQWSDLPVLFVAAGGAESPLAVQAMQELRNVVILDRPVRIATLASVLRMAARVRDKQRQVRDLLEERERRAQNLHELKDQAERLARTHESLARFPRESPDPVLRISADYVVLYRNAAAEDLCRWWGCHEGPRVSPAMQEIISAALANNKVMQHEISFDSRTYWLTISPFVADGYVNIYGQDITARKQAEQALRESEERFRRAINATEEGLWEWDILTDQEFFSPRWCEIIGYSFDDPELPHTYQSWVERIHPDDSERVTSALKNHLEKGTKYDVDYRHRHKSGEYRWQNSKGQAIHDERGKPAKMVGCISDITERKRADEALRELTATLESKVAQRTAEVKHRVRQLQKLTLDMSEAEDRERRRLAEILHDDLQQMLAAAKFHVSLMRNRAKYDASLQATAAQVDHMLKDAIEKSRSLSHELSPAVMHPADFGETLRWLANDVQAKHGLVVHVHTDGEVRSPSDALRAFLYRAAQEMLFNVVKHARVKEARMRVRRLGRCICLSISDRGRGFDPQELREAAGFGLLSVRERIELLGGRMTIKSAKGKGSTFRIVVPEGEQGVAPPPLEVKTLQPGAAGPHAEGRLRVLLADDHEVVREGLLSLLNEEHTVEVVGEAANGREAIDLAGRLEPDVVVMDVSMPLIDGDEATRQIKAHLPKTRVIALSMYEEAETVERMYQAGAESYVLKTAPTEELLAAIWGRPST